MMSARARRLTLAAIGIALLAGLLWAVSPAGGDRFEPPQPTASTNHDDAVAARPPPAGDRDDQAQPQPTLVELAEPVNVAAEAAMLWLAGEVLHYHVTSSLQPPPDPPVTGLADVAAPPSAGPRAGGVDVQLTLQLGDTDEPPETVQVQALVVAVDGHWRVDVLEARR